MHYGTVNAMVPKVDLAISQGLLEQWLVAVALIFDEKQNISTSGRVYFLEKAEMLKKLPTFLHRCFFCGL